MPKFISSVNLPEKVNDSSAPSSSTGGMYYNTTEQALKVSTSSSVHKTIDSDSSNIFISSSSGLDITSQSVLKYLTAGKTVFNAGEYSQTLEIARTSASENISGRWHVTVPPKGKITLPFNGVSIRYPHIGYAWKPEFSAQREISDFATNNGKVFYITDGLNIVTNLLLSGNDIVTDRRWVSYLVGAGTESWRGIDVFGTTEFILSGNASGGAGVVATSSSNGTSWSVQATTLGTVALRGIASNPSSTGIKYIIASSAAGVIWKSSTGANGSWTSQTIGTSSITRIIYANGKWSAMESNGARIWNSTDGDTWTETTTPTASNALAYGFTYVNGYYMFYARPSSTFQGIVDIYYSTTATTGSWTSVRVSESAPSNTPWGYSTTEVSFPTQTQRGGIAYANGTYMVQYSDPSFITNDVIGGIAVSRDLVNWTKVRARKNPFKYSEVSAFAAYDPSSATTPTLANMTSGFCIYVNPSGDTAIFNFAGGDNNIAGMGGFAYGQMFISKASTISLFVE